MDSRYQKHLVLQNRYDIEEGLNHGYTLTRIAELVGKDKTTISKEIRKHRIGDKDVIGKTNDCMNRFQCPSSIFVMTVIRVRIAGNAEKSIAERYAPNIAQRPANIRVGHLMSVMAAV